VNAIRRGAVELGRYLMGWRPWLLLVLLLALVWTYRTEWRPFGLIRDNVFDQFQRLDPLADNGGHIVVIDIDEPTIRALGQWPWPRAVMAELTRRLTAASAVVGFNIYFIEPDRLSPDRLAAVLPHLDRQTVDALQAEPQTDMLFAEAIRAGRVVLAEAADPEGRSASPPATPLAVLNGTPEMLLPWLPKLSGTLGPLPLLSQRAAGRGVSQLDPDEDGTVRVAPLLFGVKDQVIPAYALEIARVAFDSTMTAVRLTPFGCDLLVIRGPSLWFPIDHWGRAWPRFARRLPPHISLIDFLEHRSDARLMTGKIVLIGASAAGLGRVITTPVGRMSGDDFHALVVDNILSGTMLTRPGWHLGVETLLCMFEGLAMLLAAGLLDQRRQVALWAALAGLGLGAAFALFRFDRVMIDAAGAAVIALVIVMAGVALGASRRPAPIGLADQSLSGSPPARSS
jgi:adenylate cyclase